MVFDSRIRGGIEGKEELEGLHWTCVMLARC